MTEQLSPSDTLARDLYLGASEPAIRREFCSDPAPDDLLTCRLAGMALSPLKNDEITGILSDLGSESTGKLMGSATAGFMLGSVLKNAPINITRNDDGEILAIESSDIDYALKLMTKYSDVFMDTEHATNSLMGLIVGPAQYATAFGLLETHAKQLVSSEPVSTMITTGFRMPGYRDTAFEIATNEQHIEQLVLNGAAVNITKGAAREFGKGHELTLSLASTYGLDVADVRATTT